LKCGAAKANRQQANLPIHESPARQSRAREDYSSAAPLRLPNAIQPDVPPRNPRFSGIPADDLLPNARQSEPRSGWKALQKPAAERQITDIYAALNYRSFCR